MTLTKASFGLFKLLILGTTIPVSNAQTPSPSIHAAVVTDFGADPTGASSSSSAFSAARNSLISTGGIIIVPPGNYKVGVDLSTCTVSPTTILIEGWGASIFPDTASYLFKVDNSSCPNSYQGSNLKFVGMSLWGQPSASSSLNPTIDYLMYLRGTAIESEHMSYISARVAALYGWYAQYTRSTDDLFSAGVYGGTAHGVLMTGNSAATASNEIAFIRPRFNTNSVAAEVGGSFSPLFLKPQIQNNALGIALTSDLSGQSTTGAVIESLYAEINSSNAVYIRNAARTSILGGAVLDASGTWLRSDVTYGLEVRGVNSFGANASINHPSGNTDTAILVWGNNNMLPSLQLLHAGPTEVSVETSGSGTMKQAASDYTVVAAGNTSLSGQSVFLKASNSNGAIHISPGGASGDFVIIGNPTGSRFITFPDGNITVSGVNAENSFTAPQHFTSSVTMEGLAPSSGIKHLCIAANGTLSSCD